MASSGPIFDSQNGDGFLVAQFQDFYTEVLRLKSQVLRSGWAVDGERRDTDFDEGLGTSVADEPTDEGAWPAAFGEAQREEVAPSAVWQVLVGLLTRQGREARRVGGDLAGQVFSRAQYVMAALADEIFLNLDWAGRDRWRSNLIESKLFDSHSAGDTVFERLDDLLVKQDASEAELARLYLAALALGFQGRYRDTDDGARRLFDYRKRLLVFITQREATVVPGKERFFPQAYSSVLDQGRDHYLPYLRPWVLVLLAILAVWVLISIPVWHELTAEMLERLDAIQALRADEP